jgi:hypothetical protein
MTTTTTTTTDTGATGTTGNQIWALPALCRGAMPLASDASRQGERIESSGNRGDSTD